MKGKRIVFYYLFSVFLIYSCNSNKTSNKSVATISSTKEKIGGGIIKFEHKIIDKGIVYEGDVVKALFKFKNLGFNDVLIDYAGQTHTFIFNTFSKY